MTISPEAQLSWQKALRKLDEACRTPVAAFPGIVVTSSYFAMRHAAVALLLALDGSAPSAESAIIARFGTIVGEAGHVHGEAFNHVFNLRTTEDYDPVDSPSQDDAREAKDDAVALLRYCATTYEFPMALPTPAESP